MFPVSCIWISLTIVLCVPTYFLEQIIIIIIIIYVTMIINIIIIIVIVVITEFSSVLLYWGLSSMGTACPQCHLKQIEDKQFTRGQRLTHFGRSIEWKYRQLNSLQQQSLEMFCQKRCFKNFTQFTGKHLFQSLFFNKVAGLRPATLLKINFGTGVFLRNFVEFLRPLFLQNTSGRLLLFLLTWWSEMD